MEAVAKKKLALFISKLTGGGAQRVVSTLSFGLSKYYQVYLILHDGKQVSYPYEGELYDLKIPASNSWLKRVPGFINRIRKVKKFKQQQKPAAVISFMENANFLNILSGSDAKTIISVRNYKSKQSGGMVGKIYSLLIKKLYNKSDCLVAPSKGVKEDLHLNFAINNSLVEVIYNPYDLGFISQEARAELSENYQDFYKKSPILVTSGSLEQQKGQWHLIRAFKKIKEELPGSGLIILGEGGLRSYLEGLIKGLGLDGSVLMPGFQANPFKFISRADIFILPSLYEGFPNVLVEAMACGLPVIAADCRSGPREILAPESDFAFQAQDVEQAEYGVLVPVGEWAHQQAEEGLSQAEMAMAKAVNKIWADRDLKAYYHKKSLERAEDFKLDAITEQWVQIIEK